MDCPLLDAVLGSVRNFYLGKPWCVDARGPFALYISPTFASGVGISGAHSMQSRFLLHDALFLI